MKDLDLKLAKLLRSAAEVREDGPAEAPFGFDTRVVALWRGGAPNGNNGIARLLRRVAVLAVAVIAISSTAVVYELNRQTAADELFTNAYGIADSAIETEVP
jgi:hypothetical protein